MKYLVYLSLFVTMFFSAVSCNSEASKHPYGNFFYPYDEDAKFYVYRDVIHGLDEKFYRIYGIDDSYGKHIVVESYAEDGRITEAYNYNLDSLSIIDHMVVDGSGAKTKAQLFKNRMFPTNSNDKTWFASRFPGFLDSTFILSETKRSFFKSSPIKTIVMNESKNTIILLDTLRFTIVNPFTKKENEQKAVFKSYFAEGLGLVRIHDVNMKTDYKLEKILTQEEWVQLMQK
jgi:hypothetical protein